MSLDNQNIIDQLSDDKYNVEDDNTTNFNIPLDWSDGDMWYLLHVASQIWNDTKIGEFEKLYNKYPDALKITTTTDNLLPIHLAVDNYKNNTKIIDFLLDKDTTCETLSVNTNGQFPKTPIHIAIQRRVTVEIVKKMLNKCPNVISNNQTPKQYLESIIETENQRIVNLNKQKEQKDFDKLKLIGHIEYFLKYHNYYTEIFSDDKSYLSNFIKELKIIVENIGNIDEKNNKRLNKIKKQLDIPVLYGGRKSKIHRKKSTRRHRKKTTRRHRK
jgi:hypothetical protein